jgi:hypothetical protein
MNELERTEFARKVEVLRGFLRDHGYQAALLGRRDDFAWITTGGDSKVLRTQENGVGILAITPHQEGGLGTTLEPIQRPGRRAPPEKIYPPPGEDGRTR